MRCAAAARNEAGAHSAPAPPHLPTAHKAVGRCLSVNFAGRQNSPRPACGRGICASHARHCRAWDALFPFPGRNAAGKRGSEGRIAPLTRGARRRSRRAGLRPNRGGNAVQFGRVSPPIGRGAACGRMASAGEGPIPHPNGARGVPAAMRPENVFFCRRHLASPADGNTQQKPDACQTPGFCRIPSLLETVSN